MKTTFWKKVCSLASKLWHAGHRGLITLARGARVVARRIAQQYEEDDPFVFFMKAALAGTFLAAILALVFGETLFFLALVMLAIVMGYATDRVLRNLINTRRLVPATKSQLRTELLPLVS